MKLEAAEALRDCKKKNISRLENEISSNCVRKCINTGGGAGGAGALFCGGGGCAGLCGVVLKGGTEGKGGAGCLCGVSRLVG